MNIVRSARTTRPESPRRETPRTLVSQPCLTGHDRGAGVGRGPLKGCVMRCTVARSPCRGPRGPSITALQLSPEETVADAFCWARRRQALKAGSCNYPLGQRRWSGASNVARSRDQSHDLLAKHGEILKSLYPYGAFSLAPLISSEKVRLEADPMRPGVSRPVVRLCCFLCRVCPRPGVAPTRPTSHWGEPRDRC